MILKGSQRSGAAQLAAHLLNDQDNDHIRVFELRGFMATDLAGAFAEVLAISKGTQCRQELFSLSLNPPLEAVPDEDVFIRAADEAETRLGLSGQPRAIVLHEKEGRRHAHVVWSRIDAAEMKAINLPHFKRRLTDLTRELFLEHGWKLPDGLRHMGGRDPMSFSLAEWQQAARTKRDPREIKDTLRDTWDRSDTRTALANALQERGFLLARGDRRGFVVMDFEGQVYSLPKWLGLKTRDVKERLGDPAKLPDLQAARKYLRRHGSEKLQNFISTLRDRHTDEMSRLREERGVLITQQRAERAALLQQQSERWDAECAARAKRLHTGLRGLWQKLSGKARAQQALNEREAWEALTRDRRQRDAQVLTHQDTRRALQTRIHKLREAQKQERRVLAREAAAFLSRAARKPIDPRPRDRKRDGPGDRSSPALTPRF